MSKINKHLKNNMLLYFGAFTTIYTLLPLLAPLFAHFGLTALSDSIYWLWQFFCHQRPWRSYHLFDYQFADCARCSLIFGSISVSTFIIHLKKIKPLRPKIAILFGILMTVPLALDGTVQLIAEVSKVSSAEITFYESTNLVRSITGAFLGTGIAFSLFPFLLSNGDTYTDIKEFLKIVLASFFISLLLVPIFVFMWFSTSTKYLPSNMLYDHVSRFPGYNYEITSSSGHSTIKRTYGVTNEEYKFIARAKLYNKQDLLDAYQDKENKSR